MTGTQVLLLVASETGHVYTFATPKLQPLITKQEGKNLIQACLNSPDLPSALPDYPIASSTATSGTQSVPSAYAQSVGGDDDENDSSRSAANSFSALAGLSGYAPYSAMVPSASITPTPGSSGSTSNSAASAAAAAAAQVFMNPQVAQMAYSYPGGQTGPAGAAYWNGAQNVYAPGKLPSSVQSQQQQQHQQHMYQQALLQQQHQQQQQMMQQYQAQQHHQMMQHAQASQAASKTGMLDLSEVEQD